MKNVDIKVEGKKIVITIDTTKEYGRSNSGKTTIVASTEGNTLVEGTGVTIGVNAYKK